VTTDASAKVPGNGLADRLVEAEERLSAIEQDRRDAALARQLRDSLSRLAVLGTLAAPRAHTDLLDLILRAAAQVLSARAAVLSVVDHASNELVFGTAITRERSLEQAVEKMRGVRSPLNAGIAGWVALSGQPAIRSDLANDSQFQLGLAQQIGYVPKQQLCAPLRSGETVVGVVQLFDKTDGTEYTAGDMALLDQFGEAAAVALEQSLVMDNVASLFGFVLGRLLSDSPDLESMRREGMALVERAAQSDDYRDAVRISVLAAEIGDHGADARREAIEVLESMSKYLRGRASRENLGGRLW